MLDDPVEEATPVDDARPTAGLVLAAGAGRRMGGPKATIEFGGMRLVDRAVEVLRAGGCDPVLVITGAWDGDVPDARTVHNPRWEQGLATSLAVGLGYLERTSDAGAVVVLPVDMVGVTAEAVAAAVGCDAELAVTVMGDSWGHPVRLGRAHWAAVIASARGDAGARDYLRSQGSAVVRLQGGLTDWARDLDTVEDLRRVLSRAAGPK